MIAARISNVEIGSLFTFDSGVTWWRANRVEIRSRNRVWIEATSFGGRYHKISSDTYDMNDVINVCTSKRQYVYV